MISVLISCSEGPGKAVGELYDAVQPDSMNSTAPYLTRDHRGNIVMSWARLLTDSTSVFCYAVSRDEGRSFDKPVVVPGSNNLLAHSENLPKIIVRPGGEIIAMWGAANPNKNNKYSGQVFYSVSTDEGANWTGAQPLVKDTGSYDQRYYDVALMPDGEAAVIWLDNRKSSTCEGSSLYFARTEGNVFLGEKKITEGCCQCCRTDLYIDSKKDIHVLYRGIIEDSVRDMLHSVSTDGGNIFSTPTLISDDRWILKGCPHTGPAMTENKAGLHFTWFTAGGSKGSYYTSSPDNGKSFRPRERISESGSHPQIATGRDGSLVLVWDETIAAGDSHIQRVAVAKRSADGKEISRRYVTPEDESASYPVVLPIDNQTAFIAYTVRTGDKKVIRCQRVSLDQGSGFAIR